MESLEISWQKNLVCIFWKRKSAVFYISLLFNFRLKQKSKIGIVIASASTWKGGFSSPSLLAAPNLPSWVIKLPLSNKKNLRQNFWKTTTAATAAADSDIISFLCFLIKTVLKNTFKNNKKKLRGTFSFWTTKMEGKNCFVNFFF